MNALEDLKEKKSCMRYGGPEKVQEEEASFV